MISLESYGIWFDWVDKPSLMISLESYRIWFDWVDKPSLKVDKPSLMGR